MLARASNLCWVLLAFLSDVHHLKTSKEKVDIVGCGVRYCNWGHFHPICLFFACFLDE